MELHELVEEQAIGMVLSSTGDWSYDDIVDAFQNGECPDGVSLWEPFEHWEYYAMAEQIEDNYRVLMNFAKRVKEID